MAERILTHLISSSQRRRIPDFCKNLIRWSRPRRKEGPAEALPKSAETPPKSAAESAKIARDFAGIPLEFLSNSSRIRAKTFPGFHSRSRTLPRFRSRSLSNPAAWHSPSASAPSFFLGSSRAVVQNLTLFRVVSKDCLYTRQCIAPGNSPPSFFQIRP